MSERIWTAAQSEAISHRGSDLLVSASAGSGKTATLTARLIDVLCSPQGDAEPSEVLAVTFTKAAAAEMRERLFAAAFEEVARSPQNARARRLLSSIDSVQISTIHSFCRAAITPYFASLGLAPDFRVMDAAEAKIISERAMNDVVSSLFDTGAATGEFAILSDCLASPRDEASLDETLLSLCTSLEGKGIGARELEKYAEALEGYASRDMFETPLGDVIKGELSTFGGHFERLFAHYVPLLSGGETEKYVPECERLVRLAHSVALSADGTFAGARETVCGSVESFPKLKPVSADNQTDDSLEFKAYRDKFKKDLVSLKDKYFCFTDAEIASSLRRSAELDRAVAHALTLYETRRAELKREKNAVDYGDLERLAHRVFVGEDGEPTAAARELSVRYRYVFIDEFQDTNRVQDDIFRAISGRAERFMVGDVKQSIYSFRGADPTVFTGVRRRFAAGENGAYVPMSENFRSSSNVISFTNAVSRRMFPFSPTPFDKSDELIRKRTDNDGPEPCELVLLSSKAVVRDADGEFVPTEGMSEQRYVALRVKELLASGRKPDGTPIKPGDIAILIRAANVHAKSFADELTRLGIPVSVQAKRDLFADATTLTLICLLNAVCASELDVYFTGALKSAAFGFSLADTVRLRLDHPSVPICVALEECAESGEGELGAKCRRASETLRSLRGFCAILAPDAFIRHMAKALDLEATLATGGVSRAAVRRSICELRTIAAGAATSGAGTLVQFMAYLARMMERGESAEAAAPATDAVNVLSIHHSKGLEFPVCFVVCAAKRFNTTDVKDAVTFEPTFGIASKLPDPSGLVRCDTILRRVEAKLIENAIIDEEMRTLYVAMTRARERLIAVSSVSDAETVENGAKKSAHLRSSYTVRSAEGYLGWLIAPFADGEECGAAIVKPELRADAKSLTPDEGDAPDAPLEGEETDAAPLDQERVFALRKLFERRFGFEYPYAHLAKIPAKLTVSRLYPEILDEEPELEAKDVSLGEDAPMPRFLSGEADDAGKRAAEIGTATHVFMQFCDFERLAGDDVDALVDAELSRLRDEQFIDEKSASLVDRAQIAAFVRSPLFSRIRAARRVWREFRFNSARPAAQFTADEALASKLAESGADVIVQGVVDLLFEDADGRFVLVDYKTDRLTDYERAHPDAGKATLRERHKNQLTYYRDIVGDMTPKPIDETLIYSLAIADTVEIG